MYLLTLLLSTAGLIEVYRAAGTGSPEVFASLWSGSGQWFARPAIAQLAAGMVLLALAWAAGRRSMIAGWMLLPLQTTRARRARWLTAGVLAVVFVWLVGVELNEIGRVISRPTDFGAFYHAARAVAQGQDPYAATSHAYFYPPPFAHFLAPLTWLPPGGASVLWFVLKLWLFTWATRTCFDLLDGGRLSDGRRVGLLFGMLAASARFWTSDLQFGNSNIVILALVVGALHFDRREKAAAAGIFLAAAATIKIVPIIVGVHLIARGRWRAVLWTMIALVIFNALPFASGLGDVSAQWSAWADAGVARKLSDDLAQPDNQSLWGFLGRTWPQAGSHPMIWRILWALASMLATATAAGLSRRSMRGGDDAQALARSLYPGVILLISPGSWVVHYVGAMLPLGALLRAALGRSVFHRAHLVMFVIACFSFGASGWWRWSIRLSIEQSWYLITLMMVLVTIALSALRLSGDRSRGRPLPSGSP